MKKCTKCDSVKLMIDFDKDSKMKDKRRNQCKRCRINAKTKFKHICKQCGKEYLSTKKKVVFVLMNVDTYGKQKVLKVKIIHILVQINVNVIFAEKNF